MSKRRLNEQEFWRFRGKADRGDLVKVEANFESNPAAQRPDDCNEEWLHTDLPANES